MRLRAFATLLLASSVAVLPAWASQRQNSSPYGDDPQVSSQPAPPSQNQQANQQADQQQNPQKDQQQPQEEPPQQQSPAHPANLPATLTLPAGVIISVRTNQWLSSDRNHPGDIFTAVLDQPLVVHGWVVARRGQTVTGRVDVAQKSSEDNGVSKLGLEITELTLVDGEQVPVSTEMRQAGPAPSAPGSTERNVATVGTTTVLGTIIGAAVGGGQGAAVGAGLGATAGLAAVLYTRGRPTTVAPEALLSFRLSAPLDISTEKGEVAFQPVTQNDYKDQDAYANAPRRRGAGPGYPPPYYYYGYCGPWGWNCYPGPYFGPYIGVGIWGPGFGRYGRFR
jgi:hypothetical protein